MFKLQVPSARHQRSREHQVPGEGSGGTLWSLGFGASLVVGGWWLVFPHAAQAQPFTPHAGYVYPAGGRQGATFQVLVGGQYLNGATQAFISGQTARVTVLEYNRPMTQKEFNDLRDELRTLQEKRRIAGRRSQHPTNAWTTANEKRVAEIRNKILKNAPNRQGTPAIAETVTLQVTIAPEAEPGQREIRLESAGGLSNPLVFCIGQLAEVSAPAAKAPNPDLERFRDQLIGSFSRPSDGEELGSGGRRVTIPATINGQIMPGEVDRWRFTARKGQQLIAAVTARELLPYLADAVPGWFQAAVTLCEASGKELAYNDDFRFHPDPVLHYEIPRDGEYILEIKDALYRGREDFVYRIAVGELPFVTSVFPLGGQAGTRTAVELTGWNLPINQLTVDLGAEVPTLAHPTISLSQPSAALNSPPKGLANQSLPFAVDTLAECVETEPNDSPDKAQKVVLPIIVNGRINQPGDWDVFRFNGRAGEEIVAEVYARRLDSPLDSVLKLTDATGRQLAFNDDHEDKGYGLNTHHADSYLRATLPTDGFYYVHLGDIQHKGGPEYAYRLRLSGPRPDFALRVVPSSVNVRAFVSVPLTVYALRQDNFTNEVRLELKDAPPGFVLSGARVPANQDKVRITFTASPPPMDGKGIRDVRHSVPIVLEGHTRIADAETIRAALPAEDMMQAFAYRHLVPAQELQVNVFGQRMFGTSAKILGDLPVKIPADGTARVRVAAPFARLADRFQFELGEPPEGIAVNTVSYGSEGLEITFRAEAGKTQPGLKGNLIVNVIAGRTPASAGKGKPPTPQRRAVVGALPAIPFELVAQ